MFLDSIISRLKFPAIVLRSSPVREMPCGDCDRVNSCGLPPDRDCEERLAQTEMAERYNLPTRRIPCDVGF